MKKSITICICLIATLVLVSCQKQELLFSSSLDGVSHYGSSPDSSSEHEPKIESITFPAYITEGSPDDKMIQIINDAKPFKLSIDLPDNWIIKNEKGDETVPTRELYSKVFIYDDDKLVGYIGFDLFEPYTEEIEQENYYKTVYPKLRLPSIGFWDPYTAVKTTNISETGVVDIWYLDLSEIDNHPGAMPDVPSYETNGILSYNKELGVYIGVALMPDMVVQTQVEKIAQSISMSPLQ